MKISVVGMGLIGGSLWKAARCAGYEVAGFDRGDPVDVSDSGLVLVALPPSAVVPWIAEYAGRFAPGAIVVDMCGVKAGICRAVEKLSAGAAWLFVGGHPMAGKEVSGFANSDPGLFRGASMILTPGSGVGEETVARLADFFAQLGFARTVVTDPEHHDRMIAFTSQLGHVIANAYVRDPAAHEAAGYAAGSYANMTRIASMDPAAWTDLFLANRDALVRSLDGFIARLQEFGGYLRRGDREKIERCIADGAKAKKEDGVRR